MIVQRTEEWYAARLGKVTASRMNDVMSWQKRDPTKETDKRASYRKELVAERLTGEPANPDQYVNYEMRWGMAYEAVARTNFELQTGLKVEDAGFEQHPELAVGASPDGFVGEDATLEIKCMKTTNHLYSVFIERKTPDEYMRQIMTQLWITGREKAYFVAYDPRLPKGLDTFIECLPRDEDLIGLIEHESREFLDEVDRNVGYFLSLLPTLERSCHECGTIFASKTPKCESCGSKFTTVKKG